MIVKKTDWLLKFIEYYINHNYPIDEVNLFGIHFPENQDKDIWNDILGVWTQHNVYCWPGTTDPGKYWTVNQPGGAAHLCEGYHPDIWQVGIHAKGTDFAHPALVQYGNKVKIWRDVNRDYEENDKVYEEGYFGINWHRAKKVENTPVIGPYSAGCIVSLDSKDFEFGLNMILNTNKFKEHKNCKFSFMLFKHEELGL